MSTLQPESRVRLPDGRYGTVKYLFSQYPFVKDASVQVDGKRERELWATADLTAIHEPAAQVELEAKLRRAMMAGDAVRVRLYRWLLGQRECL